DPAAAVELTRQAAPGLEGEAVAGGAAGQVLHRSEADTLIECARVGTEDLPGVGNIRASGGVVPGPAVQGDLGVTRGQALNLEGVVAAAGPELQALQGERLIFQDGAGEVNRGPTAERIPIGPDDPVSGKIEPGGGMERDRSQGVVQVGAVSLVMKE